MRQIETAVAEAPSDIGTLAKGGRTNIGGFAIRLIARMPFVHSAPRAIRVIDEEFE